MLLHNVYRRLLGTSQITFSVGPMLAYVGPILAYVGPMLAFVGPLLAYVGPTLAYQNMLLGLFLGMIINLTLPLPYMSIYFDIDIVK